MIFDDRRTLRTINDAPEPEILKIFFRPVFHQTQDGISDHVIDKTQLQFNLKRTNFSLRRLKENTVVNELTNGIAA